MRARSIIAAALTALLLAAISARAQDQGSAYTEVGKVHFLVSCTSAAQEQFDHGVALLHSFFWPETIKAFNAAAAADPAGILGQELRGRGLWRHPALDGLLDVCLFANRAGSEG